VQLDGRVRFWAIIPELNGKVLRVVTLEDRETIHNAFLIATSNCSAGADMKLQYDQESDSLYIDLNARPSVDSKEIQDGFVIDLDSAGQIVGIDIQHASKLLDLATLETKSLPLRS
jgi:uncharacterized protein YuzE